MFFVLLGLLFSLSITKYLSLHSSFQDLGIFLNHFFNIAQGEWWRTLTVHFQPLMLLWSAIYKIFPDQTVPFVILSLQAAFLSLPVLGLYRQYGFLPALAYCLYFPVWFNALFDFHMDHMAVPLVFGFFFFLKKNQIGIAISLGILLALVKEPYALQTIFCGLFLILFYKKYFAGIILILTGSSVFFIFGHYVAPFFSVWDIHGMLGTSAYSWLGETPLNMIGFILLNPHKIFQEIFFENGKIYYLLWIFASLAFIPLLKPRFLLVCLPTLGIALLSRNPNYYGIEYHYTAGLIAPLTVAFAEGLPKAKQIWQRIKLPGTGFAPTLVLGLIFCNVWISPSPISRYFWKSYGTYSFNSYKLTDRETLIKRSIVEHIPADPDITVSTQNTVNWGYLAHRKKLLGFPNGVNAPDRFPKGNDRKLSNLWKFITTGKFKKGEADVQWADYVVLDLKRAWFIGDKGCVWIDQKCKNNPEFASKFRNLVQQTRNSFDLQVEKDGFLIFKRATDKYSIVGQSPAR
jgi:uncharacterized membrane protein